MTQTAERIRHFLIEEGGWDGPPQELTDDLPLIENHVIDSMGLLRLVAWLQDEYGIEISDTEIVPSNFGSIAGISQLVDGKRRQSGA